MASHRTHCVIEIEVNGDKDVAVAAARIPMDGKDNQ